eukprot:365920-Chlamydomonas_euryale.AAC.12
MALPLPAAVRSIRVHSCKARDASLPPPSPDSHLGRVDLVKMFRDVNDALNHFVLCCIHSSRREVLHKSYTRSCWAL